MAVYALAAPRGRTISEWVREHPLGFATLVASILPLASILIRWPLMWVWWGSNPVLAVQLPWVAQFVVGAAMVALLIDRLGWWRRTAMIAALRLRLVTLLWLPTIATFSYWAGPLAALVAGRASPKVVGLTLAVAVLHALLVGFAEEGAFRGLILQALLPSGRLRAVAISSVLFGAMHAIHLVYGRHPLSVTLNVLYATCFGVAMAALRLRPMPLWPLVLFHAGVNLLGDLIEGPVVGTAAPWIGYVTLGLFRDAALLAYSALLLLPSARRWARRGWTAALSLLLLLLTLLDAGQIRAFLRVR